MLHTIGARATWRNRMPFNTSVVSVFFCLLSYTRLYRTKCVHHHDDHRRRSQLACYPRILATLLLYLVSTGYAASSNIKQKTKKPGESHRSRPMQKGVRNLFAIHTFLPLFSYCVTHKDTCVQSRSPDLGGGPSSVAIG